MSFSNLNFSETNQHKGIGELVFETIIKCESCFLRAILEHSQSSNTQIPLSRRKEITMSSVIEQRMRSMDLQCPLF